MKVLLISVGLGLFWALVIRALTLKFLGTEAELFYFWWFACSVVCGTALALANAQ